MNIGIVGCGYVGLANAAVWAGRYKIGIWDIDYDKIGGISRGEIPFEDKNLDAVMKQTCKQFITYDNMKEFINNNTTFFIAVPTDFDDIYGELDTNILEDVIKNIIVEKQDNKNEITIIIKSTIPIGFTHKMQEKYKFDNIFYVPEFLREGTAYDDCLHPQRIVVGGNSKSIKQIIKEYLSIIELNNKEEELVLYVSSDEAECIKLFSNAYLAMRVAFFNEVDLLAEQKGLSSSNIIKGICKDKRIGDYYNNPSFGYGGYCLPKDTKELAKFYDNGCLIKSTVTSNEMRKRKIVKKFIKSNKRIGIYKLGMKYDSDNLRGSAIYDILRILEDKDIPVIVYDPANEKMKFKECVKFVTSLEMLNECCDVIVTNRMYKELEKYAQKVYTRDIYSRD